MIIPIVILLAAFGLVMILAAIHWESKILAAFNVIFFFVLAALTLQIEIPYQLITSADVVITGLQVYSDLGASIILFFLAIFNVPLFVIFSISEKSTSQQAAQGREQKEEG